MIGMTGNVNSTLARTSEVVLDISVEKEADTLGKAPTASTTATLAMGDALAVCLMEKKGFTKEDFFVAIDKKYKEWNGTEYSKYLRPKTLFGDKFESYVNQPEPIKSKYDGFNWNSLIANSDDMEF